MNQNIDYTPRTTIPGTQIKLWELPEFQDPDEGDCDDEFWADIDDDLWNEAWAD